MVAGEFLCDREREEFNARILQPDVARRDPLVEYRGFVSGTNKDRLLEESDCLCFPTCHPAESFGLVLLEAMACGLPVVATRWRSIPEVLPSDYPGLVEPNSPPRLAASLIAQLGTDYDPQLRERFLGRYRETIWAEKMKQVLLSVEDSSPS